MQRFRPLVVFSIFAVVIAITVAPVSGGPAAEPDPNDTRLLAEPAVSATHIAFTYAGDLWSARTDGTGVRRLTTHAGDESRPRCRQSGPGQLTTSASTPPPSSSSVVPSSSSRR